MPKPLATAHSRCRMHIGRMWFAFSMLALLPSAMAVAATQEPGLRRSDRLDLRHLGKVSEDERAVLRIEWRAGLSGVEEIRKVDEMLEQLRRMDGTIAAIRLMVRNMPEQKPAAPAALTEAVASDSSDRDLRLTVANIAAVSLVALWWFRRRKSTKKEPVGAKLGAMPKAPPRLADLPRNEPRVPMARSEAPPVGKPPPQAAQVRKEIAAAEAGTTTVTAVAQPVPPPAAPDVAAPVAEPAAEQPSAESPAANLAIIDFWLETAGPGDAAESEQPKPQPRQPLAAAGAASIEKNLEPTLQLAEIMLSMGLEQGAAQALIEYIEANPRHALYHWLKLLGIYRKRGLHKEFMETAEKLRLNFNIQAEDWAKPSTGETPTLERFSRVAEHVQKIWVQPPECIDYLERLLADNRDGERAGFPQAVAEEMLLLIEILKETSGINQAGAA